MVVSRFLWYYINGYDTLVHLPSVAETDFYKTDMELNI